MEFFNSPRGNSRFKHDSVIVHIIFTYFTLSLSASQLNMIKEKWFYRLLCWILPTSDQYFLTTNLMSSTYTDKNNPFSRCTNKHSQLETFSQPGCKRIFSNCLTHKSPAKGWPYRFRSRGTTGSSILDHDFGHLCRGKRIQMSGLSDFGIFSNFGASSIFTWV